MMLSPWLILALIASFAGSFGGGMWAQSKLHDAASFKAQQEAEQKAENWRQDALTADEVHDEEIKRIHAEHLRDLGRLRQRAIVSKAPGSCPGASPADLGASDSEVVRGWGAEFDSLRAEYIKCQATVTR